MFSHLDIGPLGSGAPTGYLFSPRAPTCAVLSSSPSDVCLSRVKKNCFLKIRHRDSARPLSRRSATSTRRTSRNPGLSPGEFFQSPYSRGVLCSPSTGFSTFPPVNKALQFLSRHPGVVLFFRTTPLTPDRPTLRSAYFSPSCDRGLTQILFCFPLPSPMNPVK